MAFDLERQKRAIFSWVSQRVPEGGRILDIGCGDGALLAQLAKERNARCTGIELDEDCVMRAVQHGLPVHHGNVEEGLDHYSDGSFDIAILSLTLQEMSDALGVIREAFRVGKKVLVVFPNFGHWHSRWQLLLGRSPQTRHLPYAWYESPNRLFFTVRDWEDFCRNQGWRCLEKGFLSGDSEIRVMANLRADVAMYLMVRCGNDASQ